MYSTVRYVVPIFDCFRKIRVFIYIYQCLLIFYLSVIRISAWSVVKGDICWDGHQVVDNFEEQYKKLFPSAFGKWCSLEAFHHSCHATATHIVIKNEASSSPLYPFYAVYVFLKVRIRHTVAE